MIQKWVQNRQVRLEVLEAEGTGRSILLVPGMLGKAADFKPEIEKCSPEYRCLSMSLRGRGKSDSPSSGFTLADHVGDLSAVIAALGGDEPVFLVAHSRGVAYALGLALKNPSRIAGLILLDHPPLHFPFDRSWAEHQIKNRTENSPTVDCIWKLQEEADLVSFIPQLKSITCPTVWVVAGQDGAMISENDARSWAAMMPNAKVWVEAGSGHSMETLDLNRVLKLI